MGILDWLNAPSTNSLAPADGSQSRWQSGLGIFGAGLKDVGASLDGRADQATSLDALTRAAQTQRSQMALMRLLSGGATAPTNPWSDQSNAIAGNAGPDASLSPIPGKMGTGVPDFSGGSISNAISSGLDPSLALSLFLKGQDRADKQVTTLAPDQLSAAGYRPGSVVQQDAFGGQNVVEKPDTMSPGAFDQKKTLEQLSQAPQWANVDISKQRLAMDQKMADGLNTGDPTTVDYVARQYMLTGTLPPLGMGKQAAAMRQQIIGRAALLSQQQGITGEDAVAVHAGTKANTATLGKQTQLRSATEGFENTMLQNMNIVEGLLKKGAGTTGVPVFNRYQQYLRGQYGGDPDVVALSNAIDTVADENAKIRSGTLGNTPATDSMRNSIRDGLNAAQTPEQILKAFNSVMRPDAANRTRALRAQEAALKSALRGGSDVPNVPGIRDNQPATGGNVASRADQTATGPNGMKIYHVNGAWLKADGSPVQ